MASSIATDHDHNSIISINVREWEVGPNHTIYDELRSAPSDDVIRIQWIAYVSMLAVAVPFMLVVFVGILRDRKCRQNPFNAYVLFMMPPDILFNLSGLIFYSLNLMNGDFVSVTVCNLQSFFIVFAFTSSSWASALITYQLHKLLKLSFNLIRYHPPTTRQVAQHAMAIYAWAAFVASWAAWGPYISFWPIRNGLYNGAFCLPMPYDTTSLVFFWTIAVFSCFVIPFLYIVYAAIDIIRRGFYGSAVRSNHHFLVLRTNSTRNSGTR